MDSPSKYHRAFPAMLLMLSRSHDQITPILSDLNSLPILYYIQFMLVFINNKAFPTQLMHKTVSSDSDLLFTPQRTKHQSWGDRGFFITALTHRSSFLMDIKHSFYFLVCFAAFFFQRKRECDNYFIF